MPREVKKEQLSDFAGKSVPFFVWLRIMYQPLRQDFIGSGISLRSTFREKALVFQDFEEIAAF
ncbi:MAG: hypothetical protein ABF912_12075, partial [Lacticaseibacillus paracasei]